MPFFTEKITSRKDIVNGSFLDFFGSHVFWYIFSHIIFWYIFLVSCSKGGWLATQSTPSSPWIRPCFCEVSCHFLFQCTTPSLFYWAQRLSQLFQLKLNWRREPQCLKIYSRKLDHIKYSCLTCTVIYIIIQHEHFLLFLSSSYKKKIHKKITLNVINYSLIRKSSDTRP